MRYPGHENRCIQNGTLTNFPVEFVLYNLPVDDRLAAPALPVPPFSLPMFRNDRPGSLNRRSERLPFCARYPQPLDIKRQPPLAAAARSSTSRAAASLR